MARGVITTLCYPHGLAFRLIGMKVIFLALATIAFCPSSMGQAYASFSWVVKRNGVEVEANPQLFNNGDHIRQDLELEVFNDQPEAMWVHMRLTLSSSPEGNLAHTSNSAKVQPSQGSPRSGFIEYEIPGNSEELAYNLSYIVFLSPHQDPNASPLDHIQVCSGSFVFQRLGGGGSGD